MNSFLGKVEKILKGSLHSIHHLHWIFKLWAGKFAWVGKAKHCWVLSTNYWKHQQIFENKKFVDISQQCFALLPQVTFPAHNLNFHWRWRWWDRIQAIIWNLFYFNWFLTHLEIVAFSKSPSTFIRSGRKIGRSKLLQSWPVA